MSKLADLIRAEVAQSVGIETELRDAGFTETHSDRLLSGQVWVKGAGLRGARWSSIGGDEAGYGAVFMHADDNAERVYGEVRTRFYSGKNGGRVAGWVAQANERDGGLVKKVRATHKDLESAMRWVEDRRRKAVERVHAGNSVEAGKRSDYTTAHLTAAREDAEAIQDRARNIVADIDVILKGGTK